MKRLKGWSGIGLCVVLACTTACGSSSSGNDDETLGVASQAATAEWLEIYVNAPDAAVVGSPVSVGAVIYTAGTPELDPTASVSDVTLTTTITGSFDAGKLNSFSGLLTCTQAPVPGGVTVTCHADQWKAWDKDGYDLQITPTVTGTTIDSTTTLSVGGVVVRTEARTTTVVDSLGADLSVSGWGGGTALVGQETSTSFYAHNSGPGSATNVKMTFSLSGPGKFSWVGSPFSTGCSWTDTTAICDVGALPPWSGMPIDVGFVGTGLGQVAITATVSGDEPDFDSYNNTTASFFDVVDSLGADLAAFGWGGGIASVGQETSTSFFASNHGPGTATNVKMAFSLSGPGKFSWVGSPLLMGCTWTDTTALCDVGTLERWWGLPLDVGFVGTAEGQVAITASVAGDEFDPYPYNNSTTSYFEVVQPKLADLAISITDSPDPVKVNGQLTYTITVTNNGPDAASNATINDWLQYGVTFVSAKTTLGHCWGGEWGYVECQLGAMASGETATIQIVVTPTVGGTLTNYVWVDNWSWWNETDPDYTNNSAVAETTVKGPNPPVVTTASQDRFPVTMGAYVPCADDFVLLDGTLHASYHSLSNSKSGLYQYETLFNPQGISGKGLSSGETYHATGMTRNAEKWTGGFPSSYSYQNNFRIIGQKTGNNLLVHATTQVTFAPDGSVKNSVTNYSFDCK